MIVLKFVISSYWLNSVSQSSILWILKKFIHKVTQQKNWNWRSFCTCNATNTFCTPKTAFMEFCARLNKDCWSSFTSCCQRIDKHIVDALDSWGTARPKGVLPFWTFFNWRDEWQIAFKDFGRTAKNFLPSYRKIPKISHGAYIFQRPFLRGLFLKGLIYGGKFAFQNRLG